MSARRASVGVSRVGCRRKAGGSPCDEKTGIERRGRRTARGRGKWTHHGPRDAYRSHDSADDAPPLRNVVVVAQVEARSRQHRVAALVGEDAMPARTRHSVGRLAAAQRYRLFA